MKQTTKNAGTDMAVGMCFGAAIGSVIDSLVQQEKLNCPARLQMQMMDG